MIALQCRMARAALDWTVRDLAEKAGVSHDTIVRIEGGQSLKGSTVQKVRAAFESEGIEFTNGGQPGVRLTRVDAKCAKCGYTGTVEHDLTSVPGVPIQCLTGASPIACPEFRKAVSAARTALRLPNQEKAAEFAAKARGDQTGVRK